MKLGTGIWFLVAMGLCFTVYVALAQQGGRSIARQESSVFVGQSLDAAKHALNGQEITFGEGGFSFAMVDPDQSNLYINIDPNHATACAFYSKSTAEITGIQIAFFPSRKQRSKSGETWVQANEIRFNNDRSYSVTFAPPLTEDELTRLESTAPQLQLPQLPPGR
jgi:hypothetical protein